MTNFTELQRANAILAKSGFTAPGYVDAFWSGSQAGLTGTHSLSENPFSETAEPVKWAAWVRGYWNGLDTPHGQAAWEGLVETGGPAFPRVHLNPGATIIAGTEGMSLRDWFAGLALASMIHGDRSETDFQEFAQWAYAAADAMLAERDKS